LEQVVQGFGEIAQAIAHGQVAFPAEGGMIKDADFEHGFTPGEF
jgi:hypothetical protein